MGADRDARLDHRLLVDVGVLNPVDVLRTLAREPQAGQVTLEFTDPGGGQPVRFGPATGRRVTFSLDHDLVEPFWAGGLREMTSLLDGGLVVQGAPADVFRALPAAPA